MKCGAWRCFWIGAGFSPSGRGSSAAVKARSKPKVRRLVGFHDHALQGRHRVEVEQHVRRRRLKDDPQLKRGDMKVYTDKKLDITKQVVGASAGDLIAGIRSPDSLRMSGTRAS